MTDRFDDDGLYFVPLGGANEIGMNLNLYHYQGKWLMVDCGIGFADDWYPGVEVIVPNVDFIAERADDLVGLVITHAHEDHIGGVPYLHSLLNCPVYTTNFTANVLRAKLQGEQAPASVPIREVEAGKPLEIGPFSIEMVGITHSIPEMHALAIRTPKGTIMHTGDWKLDPKPLVGESSDEEALKRIGDEGVLAMVCDSTNVFVEGESGSESGVRDNLVEVIKGIEGRVIVTTFASNVARLDSIIHAATDAGRRVALVGRSLNRMTTAAKDSGYLTDIPPFLTPDQAMDEPRDKVLILTTGCQGEPRAGLWRMAMDTHPAIRLSKGDTVIFSSREIPGNEKRISIICNNLVKRGIHIITPHDVPIHVSGHPARDELARMYQMVRPQIAIPVHGEQRHLHAHADYAKELQVPKSIVGYNGAAIRLDGEEPGIVDEVESGYVAVDGNSMLAGDGQIMHMRRRIRDNGVVFLSVMMDENGFEVADIRVTAPGILDAEDDADIIDELRDEVADRVEKLGKKGSDKARKDVIRTTVRKYFKRELVKKPVVEIHLMHI